MDNLTAFAFALALVGSGWMLKTCAEQLRRIADALEAGNEGENPHG